VTPEELENLAHLLRARDLMDREYAEPLDVAALARAALSLGSFSTRFTQLVGETPTAYRDRDHGALESVPGCIAKDVTRPSREPSRIGETEGAPAP
jgi:AraC-like DNA-binding protein